MIEIQNSKHLNLNEIPKSDIIFIVFDEINDENLLKITNFLIFFNSPLNQN
jgi:hypothetical protein